MHIKRDMTLLRQRCVLHFRQLGLLFWLPVAVVNFIVPVLSVMAVRGAERLETARYEVLQIAEICLPFFSVWWVLFVLREYIEGDGNEVLFVRQRTQLLDMSLLLGLYLGNIALLYAGYSFWFDGMLLEWCRMACICVWYFGLVYGLTYLLRSITLTLMVVLLYTIASTTLLLPHVFPLYEAVSDITVRDLLSYYVPLLLLGLLLVWIGWWKNRRGAGKNI